MLKLAKLLHCKGLSVTFLNSASNHKRLLKSGGPFSLDASTGFRFETFPDGFPDSSDVDAAQDLVQLWRFLKTNFLGDFLDLVARFETPPTCIISDGFMTFANTIGASEKLGIPVMLYWTLSATGFVAFYLAKDLAEKGLVPLKDESYLTNGYLDTTIDWVPGMERIRLKDLPEYARATHPNESGLEFMVETAKAADKVSHLIIHTFDELEASLVKELKSKFLHIYPVGPLELVLNQIAKGDETKKLNLNGYSLWKEEPKCVQWLESKEPNSVVYVNFGSLAVMSSQDLLELGWGLANSNRYFLWIIRPDLVVEGSASFPPELKEIIAERGFIGRWCSQEEVLNHPSVGGFLTHGGWGSTIESLSAGVPMICWPFDSDQWVNCRQMCIGWEVGKMIGRNMKRDEVEKVVRELMEGEEGKQMKKKAMEWKKLAKIAATPSGSSCLNIDKLVNEITRLS